MRRQPIHPRLPGAGPRRSFGESVEAWVARIAMVAVPCIIGACASAPGGGSAAPSGSLAGGATADGALRGPEGRPPAVFIVESQHPGPVSVYATNGASRVRLATVTAWRTVRLPVPPDMVGRGRVVRLVARPVADRTRVVKEAIAVEPGNRVTWTILDPIESSIATLRVTLSTGH